MKFRHLYKTLNILFVFALVMVAFSQRVTAVTLADPVDQFMVSSPGPNSLVSGIVNTIWRVSDDEQTSIPYEINLLDTATCSVKIASVSSGNVTSSSSTITTSWNSAGAFPQTANLNDGNYCMQVCVSLRNGTTPYSACNGRIITIRNTNRSPIITSAPPTARQITPSEAFTYDVNAYDPDGDPISYLLVSNPDFISINPGTGVITSSSGAKPAGSYTITVQVRDSLGATAQQSFDLTITGGQSGSSTSTTTTPAPDPSVKFTSPIANEVFVGKTNEISWEISNGGNVNEVIVLYTKDGSEWIEITKLPNSATSYMWDVSKLEDGQYTLQLLLKTTDGHEFRQNSDPFTIKNTVDPNDLITKPLIVDVVPSDGASIRDRRPLISGKFTPPIDGTMDVSKFKFTFDDQELADICEVTPAEFKCTLSSDLELGVHKVIVEIQDFDQQVAEKEWSFTIIEDETTTSQPAEDQGAGVYIGDRFIPRESLIWAILICCGALLLLLVPWVLYSIWRRREDSDPTEINVGTEPPPAPILPEISYTAPSQELGETKTPEVNVNYYYPEYAATEPQPLEDLQPTVTVNTETVPAEERPIQDQNQETQGDQVDVSPFETGTVTPEIIEPQIIEPQDPQPNVEEAQPNTAAKETVTEAKPGVETNVINADPLMPAQETAEDDKQSSTNIDLNDPLAPASNQPDWLNATQPEKKDDTLSAYGYGSKVD